MAVEDADETVSLRTMDRGGCVESGDHFSFNCGTPFSRHSLKAVVFITVGFFPFLK